MKIGEKLPDYLTKGNPLSRALRLGEVATWKTDAKIALSNPVFTELNPALQDSLVALLAKTKFLNLGGPMILREMMEGQTEGGSFVIPTVTIKGFTELKTEAAKQVKLGNPGGFAFHNANTGLGVICLKPSGHFNATDRRALVSHELTHLDDFLNGEPTEVKMPLPKSVSPSEFPLFDAANKELKAYRTAAIVLSHETGGVFDDYVAEIMDSVTPISRSMRRPNITNYPYLSELQVLESTSSAVVLENLYDQGTMDASLVVRSMDSMGLLAHKAA